MPRATQTREDQILDYFTSADLNVAQVILRLATTAVKARITKSEDARKRARAGKAPATASPALAKALDALTEPVKAKPKAKAKRVTKPPKKSHKKQVTQAVQAAPPAAPAATEDTYDLPETGGQD